jgi:hypothetical protein
MCCPSKNFQQTFDVHILNSTNNTLVCEFDALVEILSVNANLECHRPMYFLCSWLLVVRDSSAVRLAGAVGRQSALHKENSGFAAPTLGRHISTFRGYWILFSIRNPYINRFTNHFYSFITILPSESGVTLDYSTIFP